MQTLIFYLKSLFFNFLAIFFANHIFSGIDVVNQTKLPHMGGDLIFAAVLGFLNSLIFPLLRLLGQLSGVRMALIAIILNFAAYALLTLMSLGIEVSTVEGYVIGSSVVALGSFLTNYLEMKHFVHQHKGGEPQIYEGSREHSPEMKNPPE